jgi:hypothetical protein
MENGQLHTEARFSKFLEANFPDLFRSWNLTEDQWIHFFAWYFSTKNIFHTHLGYEMVSFAVFRPMTKSQLGRRGKRFEFDKSGEYLYVPIFVTKKSMKGQGMWNLTKGMASYVSEHLQYPNIKFIAYENFRDVGDDLNIVSVPPKHTGRRDKSRGRQKRTDRPSTRQSPVT